MRHTPGPWVLSGNDWAYVVDDGSFTITDTTADNMVIASRAAFGARADEMKANAHLIAAAPDLLAALERLATQMENLLLVAEVPDRFAGSFNEGNVQARAAIAKARGGQ